MSLVYVDSSAMIKSLVDEFESDDFEQYLENRLETGDIVVSSAIMTVELSRFGFRMSIPQPNIASVLQNVSRVAVSRPVIEIASSIHYQVKSLDAIHLGTAIYLQEDAAPNEEISAIVTYDAIMIRVGEMLGFEVVSPNT